MPSPEHAESERLAARAETLLREGRALEARELYGAAADAEERAVNLFAGINKTRTFSILAVSHSSLLYKAKRLEAADRATCFYLGHRETNDWARLKLRELLEVIWDERTIEQQGQEYSGQEVWIALRGGEVGSGTAPVDLALHYMNSTNQFMYRAVEWAASLGFRLRGAPSPAVQQAMQVRATQPVLGSYKFAVRLLQPAQMSFLPEGRPVEQVDPRAVAAFVVDFLRAAADSRDEVERVVPDPQYRRALLQLARNLVPADSKVVREIEVMHLSTSGQTQSALLVEGQRAAINAALKGAGPATMAPDAEGGRDEIVGVLRALHLDDRWLAVTTADGTSRRYETREDVLDDVVGPMVNRRVLVTGRRRPKSTKFDLDDIELAP